MSCEQNSKVLEILKRINSTKDPLTCLERNKIRNEAWKIFKYAINEKSMIGILCSILLSRYGIYDSIHLLEAEIIKCLYENKETSKTECKNLLKPIIKKYAQLQICGFCKIATWASLRRKIDNSSAFYLCCYDNNIWGLVCKDHGEEHFVCNKKYSIDDI